VILAIDHVSTEPLLSRMRVQRVLQPPAAVENRATIAVCDASLVVDHVKPCKIRVDSVNRPAKADGPVG
jgi:hypothetical protein